MRPHLEETIEEFNEEMIKASTPARVDLFFVDETKSQVEERRRKLCHRLVYKLTCCTCRGQKDLQTAIAFLSKRHLGYNEHV